jgi:ActR/RegA family two-component response regulator
MTDSAPLIRILLADNDPKFEERVHRELRMSNLEEKVKVIYSENIDDARIKLAEGFFDVALVDLMLAPQDRKPLGMSLIHDLTEHYHGCLPVLYTSYVQKNFDEVVRVTSAMKGGRVHLINKSDTTRHNLVTLLTNLFPQRLDASWKMELSSDVVAAIERKAKRIPGLRAGVAVRDEVRVLLFEIFDRPASAAMRGDSPVSLNVSLMAGGFSRSVTAQAVLNYGDDIDGNPIIGNRCVVKIGPRESIETEVERYERHVRMGVPSEFRVELVGMSSKDSLGAVCYSFAGGSSSDTIESLDDLLRRGEYSQCMEIVDLLFGRQSRNWYQIQGGLTSAFAYYADSFGIRYNTLLKKLSNFYAKLSSCEFDQDSSRATFSSAGLSYHVAEYSDLGAVYGDAGSVQSCLTHGDLHGGNVLIDGSGRVSMIDYATVGFGPRFADFAAMLVTVRLQRATPDTQELDEAVRCFHAEKRLLSGHGTARIDDWGWFPLSARLIELALANFPEEDPVELRRELMLTSIMYAISVFNISDWSTPQRLRLGTWIAALHDALVRDEP